MVCCLSEAKVRIFKIKCLSESHFRYPSKETSQESKYCLAPSLKISTDYYTKSKIASPRDYRIESASKKTRSSEKSSQKLSKTMETQSKDSNGHQRIQSSFYRKHKDTRNFDENKCTFKSSVPDSKRENRAKLNRLKLNKRSESQPKNHHDRFTLVTPEKNTIIEKGKKIKGRNQNCKTFRPTISPNICNNKLIRPRKKLKKDTKTFVESVKSNLNQEDQKDLIDDDLRTSMNDVYIQRLTIEFDKVLIQIGLQDSSHVTFSDLKDIFVGMKLISDSSCNKWNRVCNQVWRLLTADKLDICRVSVRSVKAFVLGVCGIDSQMLSEISEFDSTPSASTQESKSADEFVFTSAEHLSFVRSKFNEMILHKLTSAEYKDCSHEYPQNLANQTAKLPHNDTNVKNFSNFENDKNTPSKPSIKNAESNVVEPNAPSPSSVVFKRSILDSSFDGDCEAFNSTENPEIEEYFKEGKESLIEVVPIISLSVHIGNGEVKNLDIYDTNMLYRDAEDFCKQHGLSDEKFDLLISILTEEIQNSLTRIDEVDEEFD